MRAAAGAVPATTLPLRHCATTTTRPTALCSGVLERAVGGVGGAMPPAALTVWTPLFHRVKSK